jgi:hypothetical protein
VSLSGSTISCAIGYAQGVHCEQAAERASPFAAVVSSAGGHSLRSTELKPLSTPSALSDRPAIPKNRYLRGGAEKRIWGDRQKSRHLGAEMHLGDRGLGLKPALDGEEPAYFPYVNSNPLTGMDPSGLAGDPMCYSQCTSPGLSACQRKYCNCTCGCAFHDDVCVQRCDDPCCDYPWLSGCNAPLPGPYLCPNDNLPGSPVDSLLFRTFTGAGKMLVRIPLFGFGFGLLPWLCLENDSPQAPYNPQCTPKPGFSPLNGWCWYECGPMRNPKCYRLGPNGGTCDATRYANELNQCPQS